MAESFRFSVCEGQGRTAVCPYTVTAVAVPGGGPSPNPLPPGERDFESPSLDGHRR